MYNKSRPVLITFSVLAGLQILTAGTVLAEVIGAQTAGLVVLAVAAVQAGMSFYVQGQVVPYTDTAAYIDAEGRTVAGPAAPVGTGQVQVVRDSSS